MKIELTTNEKTFLMDEIRNNFLDSIARINESILSCGTKDDILQLLEFTCGRVMITLNNIESNDTKVEGSNIDLQNMKMILKDNLESCINTLSMDDVIDKDSATFELYHSNTIYIDDVDVSHSEITSTIHSCIDDIFLDHYNVD